MEPNGILHPLQKRLTPKEHPGNQRFDMSNMKSITLEDDYCCYMETSVMVEESLTQGRIALSG